MIRAAAYCRVSTDREDQANSFESQQRYFREYIGGRPDWELYRIYADEGVTGTSTRKRTAFNQMLRDARAGASRFDEKHAADPLRDHPLERELGTVVRAQKVEHRFHLGASAQELRRVGLRVAADEHHLESHFGERKRNVRGGRRLSDAAFAVEGKAEHRTGFFVGTVEFEISGFEGRGLNRRHGRTK